MRVFVEFYGPSSFYGRAVAFITRSPYSHVAIRVRDMVFQAEWGTGTTVHDHRSLPTPILSCPLDLTLAQGASLAAFLYRQVGKPYDLWAVLHFLAGVRLLVGDSPAAVQAKRKARGRWFCSELVFAALSRIGKPPLVRAQPWEVSPGMLSMSPVLAHTD